MQYYYKRVGCPASDPDGELCICWHDEGTGIFKDTKYSDKDSELKLNWRTKPANK